MISPEEYAKQVVGMYTAVSVPRKEIAHHIAIAIEKAVAEEREACAKVADDAQDPDNSRYTSACEDIALAIRARGGAK